MTLYQPSPEKYQETTLDKIDKRNYSKLYWIARWEGCSA